MNLINLKGYKRQKKGVIGTEQKKLLKYGKELKKSCQKDIF